MDAKEITYKSWNQNERIHCFHCQCITKAIANLSGVSQSYLRDIELENKNPTVAFLTIVCNALGISLQDFFNEENTSSFNNNPLLQRIYKLNPEQQEALLKFLDTL